MIYIHNHGLDGFLGVMKSLIKVMWFSVLNQVCRFCTVVQFYHVNNNYNSDLNKIVLCGRCCDNRILPEWVVNKLIFIGCSAEATTSVFQLCSFFHILLFLLLHHVLLSLLLLLLLPFLLFWHLLLHLLLRLLLPSSAASSPSSDSHPSPPASFFSPCSSLSFSSFCSSSCYSCFIT